MNGIIGKKLNQRYLIMKKIAEGGFGTTYLAKDELLNNSVAIKEITPSTSDSKELDSFLLEAQIQSKFSQHDGVVSVKDYFCENQKGYLVMDFVDGISVNEFIRANGPIPAKDVFNLLKPIFSVLNEMHEQNWIHRDISADNLMITPHGDCKLIDFGSTRKYLDEKNVTMTVMFKQGFAAPEQYQNDSIQGPFTDIYGLCACLYYMLTGIKIPDAVHRLLKDDVKPLQDYSIEELSSEQCEAIMKGLSLQSEERFSEINSLFQILYQTELPEKISLHMEQPNKSKKKPSNSEINRLWKRIEKRNDLQGKIIKWVSVVAILIVAVVLIINLKPNAVQTTQVEPSFSAVPAPTASTPSASAAPTPEIFTVGNYHKKTKKTVLKKIQPLKKAGLKIVWKKQHSTKVDKGVVIKQNLPAGSTFTIGDKLTLVLTVSLGRKEEKPSPTTTPKAKFDASIDSILN